MGIHKNRNGLFNVCDNGLVQLSNCADFECRPIVYVDKHANGSRDGSSGANAYISIQAAVNAHPQTEIHIKGYGENDCYIAGIVLPECAYLKGVGDVWLDGLSAFVCGILGNTSTKVEYINIKNCYNKAFCRINYINNCKAKNNNTSGNNLGVFDDCENVDTCESDGSVTVSFVSGFSNCKNVIDCVARNHTGRGFIFKGGVTSFCSGCTSTDNLWGGFVSTPSYEMRHTYINCTSTNCGNFGFGGSFTVLENCSASGTTSFYPELDDGSGFHMHDSTLTNCNSEGNESCGYTGFSSEYAGCTENNNCLDPRTYDCRYQRCEEV